MNAHQTKVLQAFRRTLGWLAEKGYLTAGKGDGPPSAIAQQAVVLDRAVVDLTAAAAEQEGQFRASVGATAEVRAIRKELLEHLAPLAEIAKSAIPDVVKVTEALRSPANHRDHERLLAAASAMSEAGTQYKDQLVASGLPADFVEPIEKLVKAYRAAIDARGQAMGARRLATGQMLEAGRQGRRAVTTLEAFVRRELKGDPAAYAQWKQLKRVVLTAVRTNAAAKSVNDTTTSSSQHLKDAA